MDSFIDVFTLCNYCILANVLDPRMYNFANLTYRHTANATHLAQRQEHDYNALSPDDWRYFSYVRGLAINLIDWIKCHYVFECNGPNNATTTARKYLHHQVRAIVRYKMTAEKENVQGVPNCTETDLRHQISLLFTDGMTEFRGLSLLDLKDADSLSWETGLTPTKRGKPLEFIGSTYLHYQATHVDSHTEHDPLTLETTKGDKVYHAGSIHGFLLSSVSKKNARHEAHNDDSNNAMDQDQEGRHTERDEDQGVVNSEQGSDNGDGDDDGDDEGDEGEDNEGDNEGDEDMPERSSNMEYDNWEEKRRR